MSMNQPAIIRMYEIQSAPVRPRAPPASAAAEALDAASAATAAAAAPATVLGSNVWELGSGGVAFANWVFVAPLVVGSLLCGPFGAPFM